MSSLASDQHPTPPQSVGDAPRASLAARLRLVALDIKLAHSVFALPFAVLAAFLARDITEGSSRFAGKLGLIVVCMVLARTWAMLVNRIADRRYDAQNPRTARRVIASGRLAPRDAKRIALGCAAVFIAVTSLFSLLFDNPWPVMLAVPVLAWIAFYSFTKRFTWLCHVFLGGALAASPLAAAIAVNPAAFSAQPTLWWLAGMVVLWVAGFDIIYALHDTEFDRRAGLYSMPSRLGPSAAMWISRVMHLGAFLCLASAAWHEQRFGLVFWLGILGVGFLLSIEHAILLLRGKDGLNVAFFTVNGIVSCLLGVAGVTDLLV